jgi:hypothetical protein
MNTDNILLMKKAPSNRARQQNGIGAFPTIRPVLVAAGEG